VLRIRSPAYAAEDAISHRARRSSGTQAFKRLQKIELTSRDRQDIGLSASVRFPFSVSVRVRGEACSVLRNHAAGAASLVHRNSVPSSHIRCSTVARRRATATQARLSPRFLAILSPQALSQDGAFVLVRSAIEAS
jgi:hypothetical protein